jgi:regulator of protease activity HflC (stomatin/prohibitin superfamily)
MAGVFGFKIITQYEQGIVFRFGRALPGIRQPGLTWGQRALATGGLSGGL